MICVVGTGGCRVFLDYGDREAPGAEQVAVEEYSPTTMVEFCRRLYEDVGANIEGWVVWAALDKYEGAEKRRRRLLGRLERLKELIDAWG